MRCVIYARYSSDGQRVNCPLGGDIPLCDIFSGAERGTLILGGRLDDNARTLAHAARMTLEDYFEREEVCVAKANYQKYPDNKFYVGF